MTLDLAKVKVIQNEVHAAVKEILKAHGLDINKTNVTYDVNRFDISFKSSMEMSDTAKAEEDRMTNVILKQYGLQLGDKVNFNGKKFKIVGYNSRKPKNCIAVERVEDGVKFNCSAVSANIHLIK